MLEITVPRPLPRRRDLTVHQCMTREPVVVEEGAPLAEAVELMERYGVRSLPVVSKEGALMGLLSERRIGDALPSLLSPTSPERRRRFLAETDVMEVARRSPVTVTPETPVLRAIARLRQLGTGSLPVVAGDRLVGILTAGDLIAALERLLETAPREQEARSTA